MQDEPAARASGRATEDILTVQRTAFAFARFLAQWDVGRVRLHDWVLGRADYPDDELTRNHHMGAGRMAASPAEGVIDAHLRVHGRPNLCVLRSSTCPSGGHANPLLTILQLAHRLAEHLSERAGLSLPLPARLVGGASGSRAGHGDALLEWQHHPDDWRRCVAGYGNATRNDIRVALNGRPVASRCPSSRTATFPEADAGSFVASGRGPST